MEIIRRTNGPTMPCLIQDLPTPCFLVDTDRLQNNISRMIGTCRDLNIALRPCTKTHKTVEIAEMSTAGTKKCIEVSTPLEAEMYADAGFDDILYAYPIAQNNIDRCVKLMSRVSKFHVMVCDLSGLECLTANMDKLPDGKTWSVALDIDLGMGRTGFLPDSVDFVTAYRTIIMTTMKLQSLYCFCGDMYVTPSQRDRMRRQHEMVDAMTACKTRILTEFPDADVTIAMGSTPTCSEPLEINRCVGEFHPGTFVFYDYEQYMLPSCQERDIAVRVMTRVVAHKDDQHMLIVDCGANALSHKGVVDRPGDFCIIQGERNLKMVGISQEMGKIKAKEGFLDCKKYPIGTILYIYPYQANATAALHPEYYVHSGHEVIDVWRPIKGW